jgi:hypothetical protein
MGFTVSRHPTYIYQTPSGYIFRLRIPCDLKRLIGKSEFRYSLHTGALRMARHRARYIASYIHQLTPLIGQFFIHLLTKSIFLP